MTSKITIFIPTYRRPQSLKRAIESALNQTYKDLQVIVCDNASGDETQEIIRKYAGKDPRLHSICHKENLGMLGNYQYILSIINTEFFSLLSDDDILIPHFCQTAIEGFSQFPDIAFFAGSTIVLNEKNQVLRIPLNEWSREGRFTPEEGLPEMIGFYPVPTSILFKKSATIDFQNPALWDCDFLIQLAGQYPFAISKKPCGFLFYHPHSFTASQEGQPVIQALQRLMERVEGFSWMSDELKKSILTRLEIDLRDTRFYFILSDLEHKRFEKAKEASRQILAAYPHQRKALFFFVMTTICSSLKFTTLFFLWAKKMRDSLKKRNPKDIFAYHQWLH